MQMEAKAPCTGNLLSRGSLIHAKWVQASFLIAQQTQLILSKHKRILVSLHEPGYYNVFVVSLCSLCHNIVVCLCSYNNLCNN